MRKASEFCFNAGLFLDLLCEGGSVIGSDTLGNDNYEITLAKLARCGYSFADRFVVIREFGNDDGRCAGGDCRVERYISRAASHNLDDIASCVGFAGIAELIYKLDDGVHSSIEADRVVG